MQLPGKRHIFIVLNTYKASAPMFSGMSLCIKNNAKDFTGNKQQL